MRKRAVLIYIISCLLFCACANTESKIDNAIQLRQKIQNSSICTFDSIITADYGDYIYTFSLNCIYDQTGDLRFTVNEPETIEGITGIISNDGGKITFDENALSFELLADGYISPVSAPWIFINTLKSGYIRAAGTSDGYIHLIIDDSYEENELQLDIWIKNDVPLYADFLWKDRRIISLEIVDFQFL